MPIDLQCPDCEHTFQVPSSMAGKRTLCRGCNAALIVPESSVEEPLEEVLPPRKSRRPSESVRTLEEKPPNWDTPIPFHSPVPIVGVLLIALAASVMILGIYAIARDPTAATKPAAFTGKYSYATQPIPTTKPEVKPVEVKPATPTDREVILPDREVILPKFGAESALVINPILPANWFVVRESKRRGFGVTFRIHDRTTGRVAGSVPEHRDGVADSGVTLSPSGRWFAQMVDSSVEVNSVAESGATALKWNPYGRGARKLAACILLSDERMLTVSVDGSYDLWAIPSGDYIRRVAVVPQKEKTAPAFDISTERSLLAYRDGSKIEIDPLGDDDFGALCEFTPDGADDARARFQFSSDGKKLVALSEIRGEDGAPTDRVELFDLGRKRKSGGWILKTQRRPGEGMLWSAGADALTVQLPERGTVVGYWLSDGKLRSSLEVGIRQAGAQIERAGDRVWLLEVEGQARGDESSVGRLYGFDLPLRAPIGIRKDPIWEYKSGVLELKKAAR